MIPAPALDTAVEQLLTPFFRDLELDARLEDLRHDAERLIRLGACRPGRITATAAYELLEVHPTTLARQLREAGMPAPRDLIGWGRVVAAMHTWAYSGGAMSVEKAALAHGWANGSSLSESVNHLLGMRPTDWVAERKPLKSMCARLVFVWRERTEAARDREEAEKEKEKEKEKKEAAS